MKLVSPVPPRHHVHVEVLDDAGARHTAVVHADVEAVGAIDRSAACAWPTCTSSMTSASSAGAGLREAAAVTRDDRHQVAGRIGIGVEDEEGQLAAAKDEGAAVITGGERIAEDTAGGRRSEQSRRTPSATAPRGDPRGSDPVRESQSRGRPRFCRGRPSVRGCGGHVWAPTQVLTSSRSRLPTLKNGTRFSGTLTLSPVLGLRPFRELR